MFRKHELGIVASAREREIDPEYLSASLLLTQVPEYVLFFALSYSASSSSCRLFGWVGTDKASGRRRRRHHQSN